MQLDGFTVIAEYGSRFEADLAASRLTEDGVRATVQSDPAHQIAAHIVNQPGHRVLVTDADQQQAERLLAEHSATEIPQAEPAVGLSRRPRWFRWLAYSLVLAFIVPAIGGAIAMLINVLT